MSYLKPILKRTDNIFEYINNEKDLTFTNKQNISEAQALDWYRKYILKNFSTVKKQVVKEGTEKGYKITLGSIVMFDYLPLNSGTLPLYDKFPLAIPVNLFKSSEGKYCMQAINLHYLKPRDRQQLFLSIKDRLKYFRPSSNGMLKAGKNRLLEIALHTYRLDRIQSDLFYVPEEYHAISLFLPTAEFKKGKPY